MSEANKKTDNGKGLINKKRILEMLDDDDEFQEFETHSNNYLVLLLGIPFLQNACVPLFRLFKFYKYLSPMVLTIVYSLKNIEIHNGLSLDYLMHMSKIL